MVVRKKTLLITFLILTLTALMAGLVILPTALDILKIKHAIYLERYDLEKKYLRSQLLKQTLKDFEDLSPEIGKFNAIFVPAGQEVELVTAMEEVAVKNNLLQEIQLKKPTGKSLIYSNIPMTLILEGKFTDVFKYLNDLEKLNYYFNIYSMSYSAKEDGKVSATINGEIYMLK